MSTENMEAVSRLVDATRDGLAAGLPLLPDDIEWVVAKEHPAATTHRGAEAVRTYMAEWQAAMDELRFELDELVEAGDDVLAVGRIHGTGVDSGLSLDVPLWLVHRFTAGRLIRVEEYLDGTEALEAVGLPH